MGIYYLSGLGTSPGATLLPLDYLYLMLKMALNGNNDAKMFFERSGELNQEQKGDVEYIIIFTSKEVIEGTIKPRNLTDTWFNSQPNNETSIPKIVTKSLSKLVKNCSLKKGEWIKGIYFVQVDFKDFTDCYEKIFITMKALLRKEVWINLIGGSNQITLSLFLASGLTGIAPNYLYIFQDDISKIHPDIKRPNFENPNITIPPPNWCEFPFFWLGLENEVLQGIENAFGDRDIIHKNELLSVLDNNHISHQHLAKLRSTSLIQFLNNDAVKKGVGFSAIKDYNIETNVDNMTKWKEWGVKKGILFQADINSPFNLNKMKLTHIQA
ncbi:MAG: hypothetical protein JW891_03560 [Candidatus Lokiarchaeota archaeon]|nr:hypothetical protein [Candidatus Lokiarchaeota archaeon]